MHCIVPPHEHLLKDNKLSEAEIQTIARKLFATPTVCNLIEARDKPTDPERERRIAEYVQKNP